MEEKMDLNALLSIGGYYDFSRTVIDGVRGTVYKMSNRLTSEQKKEILRWRNAKILITQKQYAPESTSTSVFIGDKCFKNKGGIS